LTILQNTQNLHNLSTSLLFYRWTRLLSPSHLRWAQQPGSLHLVFTFRRKRIDRCFWLHWKYRYYSILLKCWHWNHFTTHRKQKTSVPELVCRLPSHKTTERFRCNVEMVGNGNHEYGQNGFWGRLQVNSCKYPYWLKIDKTF